MKRVRAVTLIATLALLAGAVWYLYNPPWAGAVTSGLRDWEVDPHGTRFRWTNGHASFFVPSAAAEMTLRMQSVFPGAPVVVGISIDDRWLLDVRLSDPTAWVTSTLPLPRRSTRRSFRRVELRVSRVVPPFNLGVMVGEIGLR
jgi:hypothetical protein